MQRDMEVIRTILLKIESDPRYDGSLWSVDAEEFGLAGQDAAFVYNATLLHEAGYIAGNFKMASINSVIISRMTWDGHEFLDTVRDPEVWRQTKAEADKIGGFGIDLFKALAKGFLKKKIEQHTGVALDI